MSEQSSLIVLVGTPCAGKSHWVREYMDMPGTWHAETLVVSTDAIRDAVLLAYDGDYNQHIFGIAHLHIRKALELGLDVIFDATSLRHDSRMAVLDLAPEGTCKVAVVFKTRSDLAMARLAVRNGEAINATIPPETMVMFYSQLEQTLTEIATEPWDQIVFTTGDEGDGI